MSSSFQEIVFGGHKKNTHNNTLMLKLHTENKYPQKGIVNKLTHGSPSIPRKITSEGHIVPAVVNFQ